MSIGPHDELDLYAAAAVVRARLETLRTASVRRSQVDGYRSLERHAAKTLGADHPVRFECAKSRIVAESRTLPMSRIAEELEILLRACERAAPDHSVCTDIRVQWTRCSRLAGDPEWESRYLELVTLREEQYGVGSLQASMARTNLAVARRSAGENPRLAPDVRHSMLTSAFQIARDEWRLRDEMANSQDSSSTWVAAAIYAQCALSAHYAGVPLLSPEQLVSTAAQVLKARQELHGSSHRRTVMSAICYAQALGVAGRSRQAVWRLQVLRAEAEDVGLDYPHRLPMALARALLDYGTDEAREQAGHYEAAALESIETIFGPDSPEADWLAEVLGRDA